MGDSSDSNQSDESIEAAERFDDQQTGNFGGGVTNVSDPGDSGGFAGDTPQQRAITERQYNRRQREVLDSAKMGGVPGFSERLNPTIQQQQEFARQQNEIDERGYDPTQEQINVGPGDIFGLENQIAANLRQGGKPSFNAQGNIIGATEYGPAFGGMGILSALLPDVTTYTGLREGDPFNQDDPYSFNDGNNEPELIRRRMSAETVPIEEEVNPEVSDDLALNYLQNPNYLYSGQGNLYQPYGYAQGTLVDLLRTRNLTQPQQAAANLGLFGNPGDFS
jgi:hypothetical protein